MDAGVLDRAPEVATRVEATERGPVMLISFDIGFDERAIAFAVESALESGGELMVTLAVTLPTANANAAARRHLGDPVVREQMDSIVQTARDAGANARAHVYNSPRPLNVLFGVLRERRVGLLVFGPDRRRYGRLRFRWHLHRIRRGADCLVWPLEA